MRMGLGMERKNDNLFSKIIVLLVVIMNVGFSAAVLYISNAGRVVPDSLIAAWFSFTTGELWILSGIKKTKLKNKDQ